MQRQTEEDNLVACCSIRPEPETTRRRRRRDSARTKFVMNPPPKSSEEVNFYCFSRPQTSMSPSVESRLKSASIHLICQTKKKNLARVDGRLCIHAYAGSLGPRVRQQSEPRVNRPITRGPGMVH